MKKKPSDQISERTTDAAQKSKQPSNTGIPNTDIFGMKEQDSEKTADKIHGKSLTQTPANQTGKNNLKTGKL